MGTAKDPEPVAKGAGGPAARKGRSRQPAVCYLGFRSTADGREYSLRVTDGLEPRVFVILIGHQVFASRAARFQDAPEICFARLQRDLIADPDLLPERRLVLTAQELREHRHAREGRSPNRKRGGTAGSPVAPASGRPSAATDS